MKLYLVRHGEAEYNKKGILMGWADSALTELGRAQSLETANKLTGLAVNLIISSDSERAAETAEIISGKINAPIVYDWLLRERNHGDLDGKLKNDLKWSKINDENSSEAQKYKIESIKRVDDRARAFVENLKLLPPIYQSGEIVIVTHNGTLNSLMLAINPKHEYRMIENCEVIEIEIE